MATNTINPLTIRSPNQEQLVDASGMPTVVFQNYLSNLDRFIWSLATINVVQLGARGDGFSDDTFAFQRAIDTAVKRGGGVIYIPTGTYSINSVYVPVGVAPIWMIGYGQLSVVKRRGALLPGSGLIDISGSNVTLKDFLIDGNVTVPVGLQYNHDFTGIGANDPMAPSLTNNTSVWLHGNTSSFTCERVFIQHSGGYAILLDALNGTIDGVDIFRCDFRNNRPNLFGTVPGDLSYGSWTGGIFAKGDGTSALSGVVNDLAVSKCTFQRNTGNCVWSHVYGFSRLNSNFRIADNTFLDCGLDGVLIGGATVGVVSDNTFRRIGYVCLTDTDRGTPKWLANLQATALDSSGLVKGFDYTSNSFLNTNGGCMDLDGHGDGTISGNVARTSYPGEPEYDEDQVAITGAFGTGPTSYGVNLGNTSNTEWGGKNVEISANNFINLSAGSVRLFAARGCLVASNNIVSPDVPFSPPVSIGPGGVGVNQNATDNVVKHNRIHYSPPAPAPAVFEDPTAAPFAVTDVNYVFGNCPILGPSGLAVEFTKDAGSGSPVYAQTVWFP